LAQPIVDMLLQVVDYYRGAALTSLFDCLGTLATLCSLENQ